MPTLALTGAAEPPFFGVCAALEWEWPATDAKYWITFLVFSVLPAPDSPLQKNYHHHSSNMEWTAYSWRFLPKHHDSLRSLIPRRPESLTITLAYFSLCECTLPIGHPRWDMRLFLDSNDQQTVDAFAWFSQIELLVPHRPLSLIHIWRCRRIERCRSRWSPYH